MPRQFDLARRRELARDAIAIFAEKGLDISSVELARRLGIKRGTLYHFFPNRFELGKHAFEDLLQRQMEYVQTSIDTTDHPLERIQRHLVAISTFHQGQAATVIFIAQMLSGHQGSQAAELFALEERSLAGVRAEHIRRLKQGIDEGTVKPCDPEALVNTMRALIDGLLLQQMLGGSVKPNHDFFWQHVLLPLKGLQGPGGREKGL